MKKDTPILPDELFSREFSSHEVPFETSSWEHMKNLLDEDDINPVWIVPQQKNNDSKTTLFIICIMSTLGIFSLATWMLLGTTHSTAKTEVRESGKTSARTEIATPSGQSGKASNGENAGNINGDIKAAGQRSGSGSSSGNTLYEQVMKSEKKTSGTKTFSSKFEAGTGATETNSNPFKDSIRMVTTEGKTYRVFTRKVWVPEEYEYVEKPGQRTVEDFWMGLHFTGQRPLGSDTPNIRSSAGFNLQFMSGNRIRHNSWALYGGFDWGMQFYGRGKKSNVVLNNTTQDSGFTRLHTYSMDFLGRAHLEYARFRLVPYINAFAGPRIYSTGQTVSSYLELKESESSSSHNAHASVSMMYGLGVGARLRLSPVISLDARYEMMGGTPVRVVDMDKSTFNGLSYDLKMNRITPRMEQFKVGIIFNISERDYDKKLVKEGYYKEFMYDSLYVDPRDSNKIYLPCNCGPCDDNSLNEQHSREYEENTWESNPQNKNGNSGNNSNNNGNWGGSKGGGGKKSFPGIKPPTPRPTEKDIR